MRLSPNFELSEFTFSETAIRHRIDNTPNHQELANIQKSVDLLMDPARALLGGKPIRVTSGFRCLQLNRLIGSKDNSAHVTGMAVDFQCPDFGTPLEICRALEGKLPYDQLIHEFKSWVHIAWAVVPRRQVLTIDNTGTRYGLS